MTLPDEQPSAGAEQTRHHLCPAGHTRQPAQRADSRVHEIESVAAERLDGVVQVGRHVVDVGIAVGRQRASHLERRSAEVEAGHPGAETMERQGVGADVALQVHGIETADVTEEREVEAHHVGDPGGVTPVAVESVSIAHRVQRYPSIPVRPVERAVVGVVHRDSLAASGPPLRRGSATLRR